MNNYVLLYCKYEFYIFNVAHIFKNKILIVRSPLSATKKKNYLMRTKYYLMRTRKLHLLKPALQIQLFPTLWFVCAYWPLQVFTATMERITQFINVYFHPIMSYNHGLNYAVAFGGDGHYFSVHTAAKPQVHVSAAKFRWKSWFYCYYYR